CLPGPWISAKVATAPSPVANARWRRRVRRASVPPSVTLAWHADGDQMATGDAGKELILLQHRVKKLKIAPTRSGTSRPFKCERNASICGQQSKHERKHVGVRLSRS